MRFLQNGADSTLAVEIAIKYLEDKEITNAGFGSNLNINGVVEGDATIVDHLGRSGACGAVPGEETTQSRDGANVTANNMSKGIGNPISLANLIREASIKPLSLCRVSPNILVGIGARKFAEEHGMPSVMNELLVSRNAKYRFEQWYRDLVDAEAKINTALGADGDIQHSDASSPGTEPQARSPLGCLSPNPSARPSPHPRMHLQTDELSPDGPIAHGSSTIGDYTPDGGDGYPETKGLIHEYPNPNEDRPWRNDSARFRETRDEEQDVDMVDDTVGAIAIDLMGHIAAGSSSGGIGMKHEGRVGPAALVGIGTAVIPLDPDDEDGVSVAAVTSGTGEHMATSFASHKCAERLYHSSRRGQGGHNIAEYDDDAVIESFVTVDFMGHPGVRSQPTPGAIGVMAVKQTHAGYYFYFAHNTESFALASMASTEPQPLCTMSRAGKAGGVIRGGRKVHIN